MTTVFGPDYARTYDALYRKKDYAAEVDLIERLIGQHGGVRRRRILDLGCGTGNHSIPLAQRGYAVTGVDRSAPMLAEARAKAFQVFASDVLRPEFLESDIRYVDLGKTFDAALMMFTVLGYQHEQQDLISALMAVRRHLVKDGLFIFDVWNGDAVLAQGLQDRSVEVRENGIRTLRRTRAQLDAEKHICRVHFDLERWDEAGTRATWEEDHVVRYFFPEELKTVLTACGFALRSLSSFPDCDEPVDSRVWNIVGVAQAE